MTFSKSAITNKFLLKRKKNFKKIKNFSFEKIFFLIKKNFKKKKLFIGCYFPSNFEVNILNFILQSKRKNFQFGLPVISKGNKMNFKHWSASESLYLNKFGIPEPNFKNKIIKPDIILVPLVSFDKKLNRIGYGKGYFDRALKELSKEKKIFTIGIAFSFQECSLIPFENHDYKLDCVLTDKKLIYNKKNENFIFR